jgi:uncharacterized OB-fold protein
VSARIPLPRPTALSRPHWDGCREGKLRVQRCDDCAHYVFIPQPVCTRCLGSKLSWVESSGLGTVYSYTTVHRPQRPEFAVPYVVAVVELDEGFHMLTNLVGCRPEDVEVGMPVVATFQAITDEITLPYFKPRRARRA